MFDYVPYRHGQLHDAQDQGGQADRQERLTDGCDPPRRQKRQQNVDIIITMEDLIEEFKNSKAYVIGVKDIMDMNFLEGELNKYFELEKAKGNQ